MGLVIVLVVGFVLGWLARSFLVRMPTPWKAGGPAWRE